MPTCKILRLQVIYAYIYVKCRDGGGSKAITSKTEFEIVIHQKSIKPLPSYMAALIGTSHIHPFH